MPFSWTAENDRKFFFAIIEHKNLTLSKVDHAAIAAMMGPECTPDAIRNHFGQLKKINKQGAQSTASVTSAKGSAGSPARAAKDKSKSEADGYDERETDKLVKETKTAKTAKKGSKRKAEDPEIGIHEDDSTARKTQKRSDSVLVKSEGDGALGELSFLDDNEFGDGTGFEDTFGLGDI